MAVVKKFELLLTNFPNGTLLIIPSQLTTYNIVNKCRFNYENSRDPPCLNRALKIVFCEIVIFSNQQQVIFLLLLETLNRTTKYILVIFEL
jgi:hypothetical protein